MAWLDLYLFCQQQARRFCSTDGWRRISHARGLCQGDVVASMIFVIVMEVLNALICLAE